MQGPCHVSIVGPVAAIFLGVGSLVPGSWADGGSHVDADLGLETSVEATTQSGGGGGGPLSKLTVHGFLTQAYATADFSSGGFFSPTPDELLLGIPEDGTFEYRNMAIQFRYAITQKDIVIVQLSSRQLGESTIKDLEDEIELDWAFYERRIGDSSSIKVGRVQIPIGLFNEVRDLGTILPYYRPSFAFYRDGTFTSETVDGLAFSHVFASDRDWNLEFDTYVGDFTLAEFDSQAPGGGQFVEATAEDVLGVQLFLNHSPSGFRLGLGGNTKNFSGGLQGFGGFRPQGEEDDGRDDIYVSAELLREKIIVRSEIMFLDTAGNSVFPGADAELFYAHFGYHPTDKFRIYFQYERGAAEVKAVDWIQVLGIPATEDIENTFRTDWGIALNYLVSPNVVLKLEHHWNVDNEIFGLLPDPVITPGGPALQPILATSEDGEYTILSVSASF